MSAWQHDGYINKNGVRSRNTSVYLSSEILKRLEFQKAQWEGQNHGCKFVRNKFINQAISEKLDRDEGRILSEDHIEPRRREGVRLVEGEARSLQPYV